MGMLHVMIAAQKRDLIFSSAVFRCCSHWARPLQECRCPEQTAWHSLKQLPPLSCLLHTLVPCLLSGGEKRGREKQNRNMDSIISDKASKSPRTHPVLCFQTCFGTGRATQIGGRARKQCTLICSMPTGGGGTPPPSIMSNCILLGYCSMSPITCRQQQHFKTCSIACLSPQMFAPMVLTRIPACC